MQLFHANPCDSTPQNIYRLFHVMAPSSCSSNSPSFQPCVFGETGDQHQHFGRLCLKVAANMFPKKQHWCYKDSARKNVYSCTCLSHWLPDVRFVKPSFWEAVHTQFPNLQDWLVLQQWINGTSLSLWKCDLGLHSNMLYVDIRIPGSPWPRHVEGTVKIPSWCVYDGTARWPRTDGQFFGKV